MIYKLNYKRIIIMLMIFLVLAGGILWYKGEMTNKEVPKKANFVINILEWSMIYG
ncbi:hypothetical protein [Tissierella sp.]|uniref:hypothetical protein n=1 Tax=Tissierella sp. TaxID=41274 RepID=UPI0028ACD7C4|nr:hypothetical protein [Tissierella sp.]